MVTYLGFAALTLAIVFFARLLRNDRRERAVLIALLDGPGSGLQLGDRIWAIYRKRISSGSLYPILRALEARGMLASWEEARPLLYLVDNAPKWARVRRVYKLTPGGRTLAKMWFRDLLDPTGE